MNFFEKETYFIKNFRIINKKSNNQFEIKAPSGNKDNFKGMYKNLWFYHKKCNHYFKSWPHSFLMSTTLSGNPKYSYCVICNKKISSKHRTMMTHKTAMKIRHQHLKAPRKRFFKKFNKLPWSNEYEFITPHHKKSVYLGINTKMWIYHKKCKHFSYITPNVMLNSKNTKFHIICRYCYKLHFKSYWNKHRGKVHISSYKSEKEFLHEVYSVPDNRNHSYVPLDLYQGVNVPLRWLHWTLNKPPHVIKLSPDEFLNYGVRCPCQRHFKGEDAIMKYLNFYGLKKNVDYYHSYIFHNNSNKTECLHGDIFLPDLVSKNHHTKGVAIEYDGIQHFIPIDFSGRVRKALKKRNYKKAGASFVDAYYRFLKGEKRDNQKNKYCDKNQILMIRIGYLRLTRSINYLKRIVKRTLNKELFPILYSNYLHGILFKKLK